MFQAKQAFWVPGVVFGVMSVVVGLMTLILPETHQRALPTTIEEVEGWTRTVSKEEKRAYQALMARYASSSSDRDDNVANVTESHT